MSPHHAGGAERREGSAGAARLLPQRQRRDRAGRAGPSSRHRQTGPGKERTAPGGPTRGSTWARRRIPNIWRCREARCERERASASDSEAILNTTPFSPAPQPKKLENSPGKYNISLRFSNAVPHGNGQPGKGAAGRFWVYRVSWQRVPRPRLAGGIRARRSLPAGIPQPGIPDLGLCRLIIYIEWPRWYETARPLPSRLAYSAAAPLSGVEVQGGGKIRFVFSGAGALVSADELQWKLPVCRYPWGQMLRKGPNEYLGS